MEINEFIRNFADQFDETDSNVFTANANYRDFEEWSSLTALSIIAMIDEEYDVQLKGDEMKSTKTIQELYNLVKSKLS